MWFVDFDHTLLAANSTELFVGQCAPSLLVALVDFVLRVALPWKLTGIPRWFRLRDYAVVWCLLVLMPWNAWLWRRRAAGLFAAHESVEVKERLAALDPARIVIVSFGSLFLLRAMLRGSRYQDCRVIATPALPSWAWFRSGKAGILREAFGAEVVARSTVLTDSEDDRDLLDACAHGHLIAPQGATNLACHRLYMPLRYSARVKYARSYVIDQWLLVDSCLYILGIAQTVGDLLRLAVIAPLISLSFMCVYEIGYFENDMKAALKESKPTLSGQEAAYRHFPMGWQSWAWALGLAWAALALADRWGQAHASLALGRWAILLLACRLIFAAYNRVGPRLRMYFYPVLQIMKYGSIITLFPASQLGLVLVMCQILTMWVNYIIYRLGGNTKGFPKETFRLLAFGLVMLLLVSAATGGAAVILPAQALGQAVSGAAILGWLVVRIAKSAALARLKAR